MGILQKLIYKNLQSTKDKDIKSMLKVVKSDIQRYKDKEVPDKEVSRVIKQFINGLKEMDKYNPTDINKKQIECLEGYMPKKATKKQIIDFIDNNIDFSSFKNKMQSMKPIMQHFGESVDGNIVKKILMNEY